MSEDNELAVFPRSLARTKIEEIKRSLIKKVKAEFIDFHLNLHESNFSGSEHYEFARLLIELENMIDSV